MIALVGGLLGLGLGVGGFVAWWGTQQRWPARSSPRRTWAQRWAAATRRPSGAAGRRRDLVIVGSFVVAVVVAAVTGWVVALLVVPMVTLVLPWLLADTNKAFLGRNAALADWTRGLRGHMVGGSAATLENALSNSLATAPAAIKPQVSALVARLTARIPTDHALEAFANDLDCEQGDVVVTALMAAARQRGTGVAQVLQRLADTVSDEVAAYRQIESAKAAPRTNTRVMTLIICAAAVLFPLFSPTHRAFYTTPIGQFVLVALVGLMLVILFRLRRMATIEPKARLYPAAEKEGNAL